MKNASLFVLSLFAISFAVQPAFADAGKVQEHIDTMRQAAEELKDTNPSLSEKLTSFADEKEKWKGEHTPEKIAEKQKDLDTARRASDYLKNSGNAEGQELGNQLGDAVGRWEDKMKKKEDKTAGKAE